ncbi:vWA domain-containing protein [Rhodospira trueperi]|uniref:Ca-activated chloride channel family protein n=1 Tax=Rhodospira trueperi TaxID=69960 RepID=A0A1G6XVX8_9PROT|nr:VWA domain-containing protein [Rhodospira trueperi]SDD81565.1 Ca-activated chloride channel family protein [Rhodospira trueperi]
MRQTHHKRGGLTLAVAVLATPAVIPTAHAAESCLAIVERTENALLEDGAAPGMLPRFLNGIGGGQALQAPPPPATATRTAPQVAVEEMADSAVKMAPPAPSPSLEPPVVERDRFSDVNLNGVVRVAEQPVSTFSADVDTASMGVVRRFIRDGDHPPADAVRVEELVNYFDYDYPRPNSAGEPFAPSVTLMPSPWGEGRQVMVVGIRGWSPERSEPPPANVVLLADVSGSMHGPDRLGLVKRSMALLVDQLDGDDYISLVTYAGSDRVVLEPTPADDKETVCTALGQLTSGGGTAGSKGIATAYELAEENFRKGAVNRIILATDGDFNLGVVDDGRLEDYVARKRETGIYLSILGVGRGNYNDKTMQMLAQAGNGMAAYLDSLEEGRRVLVEKLTAQLQPIADDVKFQIEFNPARVAEYRLVGYETRMLREEDFANDAVDAGEIGDGHAVTALYEIAAPGSAGLRLPERRYGNEASVAPAGGREAEIAHLRIRWKAPGEAASRLMERPVTQADVAPLAQQSDDARFAVAVAGFAQILQENAAVGDYGLGDVLELADGSIGDDPNGHRARFVDLVKAAMRLN